VKAKRTPHVHVEDRVERVNRTTQRKDVVLYYCLTNLTTISLSLAQRANGYHLLFFVRPEQKADKRKKNAAAAAARVRCLLGRGIPVSLSPRSFPSSLCLP
jgi:hypothetical protein